MNQRADVWGFKWDGVDSRTMEGPGAGRYLFQLTDARKAVNKKKQPYVNAGCKVLKVIKGDEKASGLMHWEYLSLEPERLGFTKSFFEKIGAGHCLRPDRSPVDAHGTCFEADIIVSESEKGTYYNLRKITAVDASEVPAQDEDTAGEGAGAGEGEGEGKEEQGEEVVLADLVKMPASQLTELAEEQGIEIPADMKGLKDKRVFLAQELFGEALPIGSGPRKAAVGAAR